MKTRTQKYIFALLTTVFVGIPILAQAQMMSAKVHMRDVLVQVVQVNDLPYPSGTIRIVGECSQCGKKFRFHEGTNLVTPFYDGDMNLDQLDRFRLAKARVILNTSSEIITDILYVERGF